MGIWKVLKLDAWIAELFYAFLARQEAEGVGIVKRGRRRVKGEKQPERA
jgi:hypothetical protein